MSRKQKILILTVGWVALFVAIRALNLHAQDVPTISVNVKVVNVLASVRDKHGQIVQNLSKDDFRLEEDGRPQTIRYFSQETNLPLTLGLMVDTSLSQRNVLGEERRASYSFLDQMLRPDRDQAFVIHFDEQVELLQDVTSSKQKLEAALNEVELDRPQNARRRSPNSGGSDPNADPNDPNSGDTGGNDPRTRGGGGYPGGGYPGGGYPGGGYPGGGRRYPRGGGYPGGGRRGGGGQSGRRSGGSGRGTLLYDSIYLASDEMMRNQTGRKALILLTDGVDQGSKYSLETAIEEAQRTDTMVYGILFADDSAYGSIGGFGRRGGMPFPGMGHADGKKVLQRMSQETGGRFFEVSKKESIDQIYAAIQEELRNQYNLGFSSDKPPSQPEYRKLHLAAKAKDLQVQARDGYYAKP